MGSWYAASVGRGRQGEKKIFPITVLCRDLVRPDSTADFLRVEPGSPGSGLSDPEMLADELHLLLEPSIPTNPAMGPQYQRNDTHEDTLHQLLHQTEILSLLWHYCK